MPRSTNSRGLRGRKNATVVVDERATTEEAAEYEAMLTQPVVDEVQDERVEEALNNAELAEPGAAEIEALHARDFDWDAMRWMPPKTNGSRPCLCNRLRGHECDLTTKSRFAIGHDARFKGKLQTAFRAGVQLPWTFETGDTLTDTEGTSRVLSEPTEQMLAADQIARMVAPKLLPHVTHESRGARLQILDAAAGTAVPQTAVDHPKADEDLTDADLADVVDDAEGVDAQFVEN
jgi:hypothetical protein